jgi:ABC-type sugar transport system substrate-binding protein
MVIGHDPHVGISTRSRMAVELLEEGGANIAGGEIRQVLAPGTSQEEALKFVTDYLQANPEGLDGVWVGWDHAAIGAAQAIEEAGRDDIFVTGVDAVGIALAEIEKNGPFVATVVQDWPAVLDQVMQYMETYADSGELPEENFVETDVTLVTRDNVAEVEPTDA